MFVGLGPLARRIKNAYKEQLDSLRLSLYLYPLRVFDDPFHVKAPAAAEKYEAAIRRAKNTRNVGFITEIEKATGFVAPREFINRLGRLTKASLNAGSRPQALIKDTFFMVR